MCKYLTLFLLLGLFPTILFGNSGKTNSAITYRNGRPQFLINGGNFKSF